MNRFIILNGFPYLYANGKAYACRFDEKGFTLGAEVEIASAPKRTYSELSIKAKCAGKLDSISVSEPETKEQVTDEPEAVEISEPETKEQVTDEPEAVPDFEYFESMKLDELKEYASANKIALNGARTKAAIIDAIKAASAE